MIAKDNKQKSKIFSIFTAIFIAFLVLSTISIVPPVNGQSLMEKINQKETINHVLNKLSNSDDPIIIEDTSIISNLILRILTNLIGDRINLETLQNLINPDSENSFFQNIIQTLIGILQNENQPDPNPNNNTILTFIISFLKAILSLTATLFKILINASVGLVGGLLRIISAFISIILLILAGAQTVFTLGAVLMLFLGLMTKYGIKALSVIGAPIFSLIAAQISISIGTILGGISTVIFSLLAILLLFAIPLSIAGIVYLLVSDTEENNDDGGLQIDLHHHKTGLFYMLLSIIANTIQSNE